ncbi:hypothetical protein ZEAMMB73_Zm00001d007513 [Zea mays]|uniref:Uncharacterized protein n=1 Tax=Zea mays TaxID=4577 RepID=A0A1D6F6Z9_MAIZE|nr:hypothetical protein ZEAMMB73_Zm00001d007513 [Zea mays]
MLPTHSRCGVCPPNPRIALCRLCLITGDGVVVPAAAHRDLVLITSAFDFDAFVCPDMWQQILIDNLVGYDTIPTNSLVISPGHGYLYNFEMKELYGLSYRHETPEGPTRFGEGMLTPLDPNPLFTPNLSHLEHLLFLRFISNLHRFKC